VLVVFRNDDLAGASDLEHELRLAAIFERYKVPQTLGVIPYCATDSYRNPHGTAHVRLDERPAIVDFLKAYVARSGSEIALHGFHHRTNRLSRPAKREFFEFRGIGYQEQHDLLRRGTEMVEQSLGVRPRTFIPPWNRLDADTVRALADLGYTIVSAGPFTEVPAGLASLGTDCALETFVPRLQQALASGRRIFLRIMFHSRTVTCPRTRCRARCGRARWSTRSACRPSGFRASSERRSAPPGTPTGTATIPPRPLSPLLSIASAAAC
jgi:hypothetical protein